MAERERNKTPCNEALEEALKAREKFLKEHPDLQPFQDEIDRIMEKTVGFENRMAVLAFMIENKLYELRDSVAELHSATLKARRALSEDKAENAKVLDYSTKSDGYVN